MESNENYDNNIPQELLNYFVEHKGFLKNYPATDAIKEGLEHVVIEEKVKIVEKIEEKKEYKLTPEEEERLKQLKLDSKIKGLPQATEEEIRKAKENLKNFRREKTFRELLFEYIDNGNLKDSDVYNCAKVDRRTFSKIRNNKYYHPNINTVIRLGFALHLCLYDLEQLLKSANYSLCFNNYFYITIAYCLENKIFDIDQVNDILYACELPLL